MQSKGRNWTDVQLIISSISIAFTLGFWGLLVNREKTVAGVQGQAAVPAQDASSPTATLAPGQVLYLTASGTQAPAALSNAPTPNRRRKSGGGAGGGGGGGGGAAASTGSS